MGPSLLGSHPKLLVYIIPPKSVYKIKLFIVIKSFQRSYHIVNKYMGKVYHVSFSPIYKIIYKHICVKHISIRLFIYFSVYTWTHIKRLDKLLTNIRSAVKWWFMKSYTEDSCSDKRCTGVVSIKWVFEFELCYVIDYKSGISLKRIVGLL